MVVYNAAIVRSDMTRDGFFVPDIAREVDRVGIDGLRNAVASFQEHLNRWGGIFAGISSFSALMPPVADLRVAYPASKAYLDMALRCLRLPWRGKVKVMTVHLGHFTPEGRNVMFWQAVPTTIMVARKIASELMARSVPDEVNYPLHYALAYKYLLPHLPDSLYSGLLSLLS